MCVFITAVPITMLFVVGGRGIVAREELKCRLYVPIWDIELGQNIRSSFCISFCYYTTYNIVRTSRKGFC